MHKALIIEDNESNRYMAAFLLAKSGLEIIEAATGEEGVQKALEHRPDIIIVDIQLPDINGLEVTRRIRASELDGLIPIIAFTSYAMPGDREMTLAAGCDGYIEKPLNPEKFAEQINSFLK